MADSLHLTVRGRVATQPSLVTSPSGKGFAQFRLAHTPRTYDSVKATWTDGQTEWFSVVVERESLRKNVGFSIHKGVPVIVVGRLRTTTWRAENGEKRTGMELVAETVGIDIAIGVVSYMRSVHRDPGAEAVDPEEGADSGQETLLEAGPEGEGVVVDESQAV